MTVLQNSFEGGANGVALTAGNTGGDSGYAASSIQGTVTFDSSLAARGSRSAQCPASAAASYFRWSNLGLTRFKARFYLHYVGLQSADHWPFAAAVGGTKNITLQVISTNKLRLYTAAGTGTPIWTASPSFVAGSWYRIEVYANGLSASAATVKVAIFAGHDTVALDAYDGTGVSNTGLTPFDNVTFGKYNAVTLPNAHNIDDLALDTDPATDFVWPSLTPAPPFTAAVPINRRRP